MKHVSDASASRIELSSSNSVLITPVSAIDAGDDSTTQMRSYLSTAPAGHADWRLASAVIIVSLFFFACAIPFVGIPLARIPAFIASYEGGLTIIDMITAILLFGQFTRLRSRALLALACGYLFDALIIIPHALTFPGTFSETGLLGAGVHSTAWLYMFWHGGFPVFVICYALLKNDAGRPLASFPWTLPLSIVAVVAAVLGLTVLVTAGHALLPGMMVGVHYTPILTAVVSAVWMVTLAALGILCVRKPHTVLDVWLIVVMCAWLLDVALSAMLNVGRFDLGFYAGRIYGLLAASFVLAALLLEINWLHDRLAAARGQLAERARNLERRVHERTEELQRLNQSLVMQITERQVAEQELVGTRTFLDAIIESLPAMLLVKDAKTGKVLYLNRAGEELTGIDRGEIIGKTAAETMDGGDSDLVGLHDMKALESGKPYEIFENTMRTRKRGLRRVRTKKLMVLDQNREPKYIVAFCEDVTEQRQTEDQLRHAQKMEALGQLTGGLAHDFNNLLAIIIGNLDVLLELDTDPQRVELVQAAIGAAVSGSELTRRLLAFARRQPLLPEQVDLNDLISNISKLLRRTLGENINIALDLDPSIPEIQVDKVQLETAIANLANNARDAMPKGGRLLIGTRSAFLDQDYAKDHVEVVPGNYVAVEISDSGEGISPEVRSRIFEPFFTTKELGKGTGLGLSMVFGFVKQSGGHINVYSEPGRGTTFRLYFKPAGENALETVVDAPSLQPAETMRETVLVVEDNAKLREIVVKQLKSLGFDVIEADNAKSALEIVSLRRNIDLLFTDVVLPGDMDGCALAREVAVLAPHSKILLTSGFPGARLNDMQGVGTSIRLLSKPYRKDDLVRAVRDALAA